MPQGDNYDAISSTVLVQIARKLHELKEGGFNGRRLTQERMVTMFNNTANGRWEIERTRLAKILACRSGKKKNRAKHLNAGEIDVFAEMFGLTRKQLTGFDELPKIVHRHLKSDPNTAREFGQLYETHLADASELVGWAEFIPCSLVTRGFMHGQHESDFVDVVKDEKELKEIASQFNTIGEQAQERFEAAGSARPWTFTHLVFESDLKEIVRKDAPAYVRCSQDDRRGCLERLCRIVSEPDWKVRLAVLSDNGRRTRDIPRTILGYDSMAIVVNSQHTPSLAFWRYNSAELAWTERPGIAHERLDTLSGLLDTARFRSDRNLAELLEFLADQVKTLSRW